MPDPLNGAHTLELRDADGRSLGVFRSDEAIKELTAERDRLGKELREAKDRLAALSADCAKLRAELAQAAHERDEYLRSLYHLTRGNTPPISPEEIAALDAQGIPFDQAVREVLGLAEGTVDAR